MMTLKATKLFHVCTIAWLQKMLMAVGSEGKHFLERERNVFHTVS